MIAAVRLFMVARDFDTAVTAQSFDTLRDDHPALRAFLYRMPKGGDLHVHLSGGEPTARRDIVELTRHASHSGLYTNLITSGIGVGEKLTRELADAGLDHAQLSFQGADKETNDRLGHYKGAWERKSAFAGYVTKAGVPLTINAVIHRSNIHQVAAFIDLAVELGARRLLFLRGRRPDLLLFQ